MEEILKLTHQYHLGLMSILTPYNLDSSLTFLSPWSAQPTTVLKAFDLH